MRIEDVRVNNAPSGDAVRLTADVTYGDDTQPEELWLEVPSAHASALHASADPFMAWLAPLAAHRQEPLHSIPAVDGTLLTNLRELGRVWRAWHQLDEVIVDAPTSTGSVAARSSVCAFFTGGVDSFFTALRHAAGHGTPDNVQINDLVFVHGFDITLNNRDAADRVTQSLQNAADALGKQLLVVRTNLRETRFSEADWSRHTHGAALAGVLHALSGTYHTGLIGSSAGYRDLRVWGSHPLTDPMFSSSRMRIAHDGPAYMRVEKTAYVAKSPVALRHLRVCYQSPRGENCGTCNNCYRTMLALDALGVLGACATFDARSLEMRRAERIYCKHDFDIRQFGYVHELAVSQGRRDIAAAVQRALEGSVQLTRRIALLRQLRSAPLFWRWAPAWERALLSRWITS